MLGLDSATADGLSIGCRRHYRCALSFGGLSMSPLCPNNSRIPDHHLPAPSRFRGSRLSSADLKGFVSWLVIWICKFDFIKHFFYVSGFLCF